MTAAILPVPTSLAPLTLVWDGDHLLEIRLEATPVPAGQPAPPAWVRTLARQLTDYAGDARAPLACEHLPWDRVPPFHRQVYQALLRVPPGQTVSYKDLAVAAGRPNGARAVGQAMARNPWPLLVPCHRVLATGGGLGGYGGGLPLKQRLLTHEKGKG